MNEIKEINIYRDTPIRYLGYANEIGEAFRPIIPHSIVWFSYTIASGYVLADTINSGFNTYSNTVTTKSKNVLLSMTDTLLWQSLASVIIPGYTINRVCAAVQFIQKKNNNTYLKSRWIPTLIGLATIPVIIHPIDNLVEEIMNITYRKWIRYYPK
ncbi:mitochondrial fission process protein 1 [Apis florea]|uniref:mitochondrial fission process protein 1 n=1 Tax=Apis florea TaxID=7463 RepID=UPI000252C1E2|nr:mitochondrial fission process protein 1 [Apis florea]